MAGHPVSGTATRAGQPSTIRQGGLPNGLGWAGSTPFATEEASPSRRSSPIRRRDHRFTTATTSCAAAGTSMPAAWHVQVPAQLLDPRGTLVRRVARRHADDLPGVAAHECGRPSRSNWYFDEQEGRVRGGESREARLRASRRHRPHEPSRQPAAPQRAWRRGLRSISPR